MSGHGHMPDLSKEQLTLAPGALATRLPLIGLILGLLGLGSTALLAGDHQQGALYSYLVAFLFFLSIALGGLFFVLVLFATKAGWGVAIRRLAENAMATLPLFGLLFLPIAWGGGQIFTSWWAGPGDDPLLIMKEPYLNADFFLLRAVGYFVVWTALSMWFSSRSTAQDASGDHSITRRLQQVSAPGLILYAVTVTFASFDWLMALDPHWYSTIFGVYFFGGCLVAIFSFVIVAAVMLQSTGYLREVIGPGHYHDLGKLLFAFTVFWAYIGFSQYFLIWYGNIPEETLWYRHRLHHGWQILAAVLAIGHFALPFFFLMSKTIKQKPRLLMLGALWMLLMHLADVYWIVMPNLYAHGPHFSVLDVTTLLGVGGLFLGAFGWSLRRRALIPVKDPRLPESLTLDNA
jgi:hypothetical protein